MKHLLIIDDDPVSVLILKKMLVNAGFLENPIVFYNGSDALAFFSQSNTSNEIYYVFLDINMPEMNGWEFLDNYLQNTYQDLFTEAKFIVLSSTIDPQDVLKAKSYPMVIDFLSKPITKEMLENLKSGL